MNEDCALYYEKPLRRLLPLFSMWEGIKQRLIFSETNPGDLILDVGCGRAEYWHDRAVIGVDGNKGYNPRNIMYVVGDAARLPLKKRAFDAVTMFDFIEHLERPYGFIGELAAVLKPGGKVIITTPNYQSVKYLIAEKLMINFLLRQKMNHFSPFTEEALGKFMENNFREYRVGKRLFGMVLVAIGKGIAQHSKT